MESGLGTGSVQARVGAGEVSDREVRAGDAEAVHARAGDDIYAGEADVEADAVQAGDGDGRVRA